MKKLILLMLLAVFVIPASAATRVKGYIKKDGTYVAPHFRSNDDRLKSNNWSTKGNSNPLTGKKGVKS